MGKEQEISSAAATRTIDEKLEKALENRQSVTAQHLETLEEEVDACVRELLKEIKAQDIDALFTLISHRRDRLPLDTGITDQILSISQQILSFGAAGLGLAVAFVDKEKLAELPYSIQQLLGAGGIFYLELMILSILVLVIYMFQARFRYPFLYSTKLGNTWPYFYYEAISHETPRWFINLKAKRKHARLLYARDFIAFTRRLRAETPRQRLRNELQQYFILMAFMGYAHQFSLQLANAFIYGFVASVTALFVMLGCILMG